MAEPAYRRLAATAQRAQAKSALGGWSLRGRSERDRREPRRQGPKAKLREAAQDVGAVVPRAEAQVKAAVDAAQAQAVAQPAVGELPQWRAPR
jgi:hypothetical protein